jgi:hypothetical protein
MTFDQLSTFFDYYRLQNLIFFQITTDIKKSAQSRCKVTMAEYIK